MLQQGSIVWLTVADQAGRNPKRRPAVVVTPNEKIADDGTIQFVAAVGTFSKPLPANRIPLPWKRERHPVTGLYKECVAVCDWIIEAPASDIEAVGGRLPTEVLAKILSCLDE
jgi:mRNA-degrading endonuclease toxin of MazEF toxin-antitoxin module